MRVWWRTRPEVSRHLCGTGVTSGEFIFSGANQTCYRARAASPIVSWESGLHCAHDLHVLQTQTLSWAEWAAKQQCGRQLLETWLGTREALGRRQWLGRAVLQAGWRREQEQGQKPALALTLCPCCAVLVEMQSTCLWWLFASHRPGKAVSRDLLWSCGWGWGGSLLPDPAYNLHLFITFLKTGMCQCELVTATAATCFYLKCMSVPVA